MTIGLPIVSKFDPKGIKEATNAVEGFKSGLGKIAGLVAGAFSVAAIGNFAKEAILAAEGVQQANNRIQAIATSMDLFGTETRAVSDRLIEFAESKELNLGVDAELIKAGQAQLLTFKNVAATADEAGGAFDRATLASADLAAAGFGSIDSASIMLGKALNDPIKGITALNRAGVQFSEEQKAMIQALVDTGDTAAAQNLILTEVETQVGGTAEATVKASDKMRLGFENLGEQVGGLLLPHFENFVGFLEEKVFPVADEFFKTFEKDLPDPGPQARVFIPELEAEADKTPGEFMKGLLDDAIVAVKDWIASGGLEELITGIMEMSAKLREAFLTNLPVIIQTLVDIIMAAIPIALNTLVTMIPIILTSLTNILTEVLPQIMDTLIGMIPGLIDSAITFFNALVEALVVVLPMVITKLLEMLPLIIESLVGAIPLLIDGAIQLFLGLLDGLLLAVPALLIAVIDAVPMIVEALLGALPVLVQGAVELFMGLITGLIEFMPMMGLTIMTELLPAILLAIVEMLPELILAGPSLLIALITGLVETIPQLVQTFIDMGPKMAEGIKEAIPKLLEAGGDILNGLIEGIMTDAPRIIMEAMGSLGTDIMNGINDFFGIESPSKLMMKTGEFIGEGLAIGIASQRDLVQETAEDLASIVGTGIETGMDIKATADMGASGFSSSLLAELDGTSLIEPMGGGNVVSNTYAITVNAGVGSDPVAIGRYVTDAIKRYENVSGKVFARA